jgi:uncharacterized protein (TIGR01655 family)
MLYLYHQLTGGIKMKKLIPILMAILIVPMVLTGCNDRYNPFASKTYYYVIIKGEGTSQKDDNGKVMESREYELPAYDKEGKEKVITFTGMQQLREGAFLKLTLKGESVKTYEEVQKEDIPKAAAEKLDIE